ncbi:beta-ketoacyl reductase, partial [Streptomyces sp. 2MCAF27]
GVWPDSCERALTAGGNEVRRLVVTAGTGREALAATLRSLIADGITFTGVLSLLSVDERPNELPSAASCGLTGTLTLLQALLDSGAEAPLWCATRGAVCVGALDRPDSAVQAQVWGLGRVAALEHPTAWGGLVDLPKSPEGLDADRLCAVLAGSGGEDQVAVRPEGLYGRRLVIAPAGEGAPEREWTPEDAVLVTGGVEGPAAHVARWLAAGGTKRVVLIDPSGPDAPGTRELVTELAELGAEAMVMECAPADRDACVRMAEELSAAEVHVRTLVHAAIPHDRAPLAELTPGQLGASVSAGLDGAAHLDEVCGMEPEDPVVFFSSVAS